MLGLGFFSDSELRWALGSDLGLEVGSGLGLEVGPDLGLEVGPDLGLEVGSELGLELVSELDVGLAVFGGVYCIGWLRLCRIVLGFRPRDEEWPIVRREKNARVSLVRENEDGGWERVGVERNN